MNQIINHILQNKFIIANLVVIALILGTWAFIKLMQFFLYDEITWVLQNVFMRSFFQFKIALSTFVTAVLVFLITTMNISNWFVLIPIIPYSYLLYRIILLRNNEDSKLRVIFEFQKYSTRLSYLMSRNEKYKELAYLSLINKIALIDTEEKRFDSNEFLREFNKILTLDNFKNIVQKTKSKKESGQLFYSDFKLSLYETIDNVRKITDDEVVLRKILSNYMVLDFDGENGLHYNQEKVYKLVSELNNKGYYEQYNKYIGLLEIKASHKMIVEFFEKFAQFEFPKKPEIRKRLVLLADFYKGKLDYLPKFETEKKIEIADLKKIFKMFSLYKDSKNNPNLFNYKNSTNLIFLLKYFSSNPEASESSLERGNSIEKFDLDKDTKKELNSIIDFYL